ncbi:hypothetical protein D3C72_1807470 [compost metagenome]
MGDLERQPLGVRLGGLPLGGQPDGLLGLAVESPDKPDDQHRRGHEHDRALETLRAQPERLPRLGHVVEPVSQHGRSRRDGGRHAESAQRVDHDRQEHQRGDFGGALGVVQGRDAVDAPVHQLQRDDGDGHHQRPNQDVIPRRANHCLATSQSHDIRMTRSHSMPHPV